MARTSRCIYIYMCVCTSLNIIPVYVYTFEKRVRRLSGVLFFTLDSAKTAKNRSTKYNIRYTARHGDVKRSRSEVIAALDSFGN